MKKRITIFLALFSMIACLLPTSLAAQYPSGFLDVSPDSWYAEPVTWAVALNITSGTSETTFSPDATCTNAQVLTFLWRACGQPEPTGSNPFTDVHADDYYYQAALWAYESGMVETDKFQPDKPCSRSMAVTYLWQEAACPKVSASQQFDDVSSNASYAQAVSWAIKRGITAGTGESTFSPDATCTRAQIITFLYRGPTNRFSEPGVDAINYLDIVF